MAQCDGVVAFFAFVVGAPRPAFSSPGKVERLQASSVTLPLLLSVDVGCARHYVWRKFGEGERNEKQAPTGRCAHVVIVERTSPSHVHQLLSRPMLSVPLFIVLPCKPNRCSCSAQALHSAAVVGGSQPFAAVSDAKRVRSTVEMSMFRRNKSSSASSAVQMVSVKRGRSGHA